MLIVLESTARLNILVLTLWDENFCCSYELSLLKLAVIPKFMPSECFPCHSEKQLSDGHIEYWIMLAVAFIHNAWNICIVVHFP